MVANLLQIKNLNVSFKTNNGFIKILDDINLDFQANKVIAIIGESGCGKSVLGQAILNNLPVNTKVEGSINYIYTPTADNLGIIPQNPSDSFSPVRKIYKQMQDLLNVINFKDQENVYKKRCLNFFGIDDSDRILNAYPYELSGGTLQRVLFAMAISTQPKWVLADEPTKGLDENLERIIIDNLLKLKNDLQMSMLIITHDISLAETICDSVVIMYAGQILEINNCFFQKAFHPYSKSFLMSLPSNGLQPIPGKAPDFTADIKGCKFAARCLYRKERCLNERPSLYQLNQDVMVRCFLYAER